ncbi:MAG TPA: L-2-hydroxyglutarate oxidase, partial [Solirubrobacteraceae bacterium]|nr:L-2-hydroxyglutarate oxidase [Solirubrobacteraceae bacterium]
MRAVSRPGQDVEGPHDAVVVGAGIVGLALARELQRRRPEARIAVLEREEAVGAHQTSHNSGVVHAGIYYAPGSLKARLCVEGARALGVYCEERGIPLRRCGKLVVATHAGELGRLDELERRARANGVAGLRRLSAAQIGEVEPHARGVAALHSPATAVVDFAAVARALADDVRAAGGVIALGEAVTAIERVGGEVRLRTGGGRVVRARRVACCAGLWADRLAEASGGAPDPRIVPFRGAYLRLRPERRELVHAMVYPVPDPRLPFLGVHLTRGIDDEVTIGPTALLAPRATSVARTVTWPGTWRLIRRFWRTGLTELRHAASHAALAREAARYIPDLAPADVLAGPSGVRAQALARDGALL